MSPKYPQKYQNLLLPGKNTTKIQQQKALFDTRIKLYEEYVSLHTQAQKHVRVHNEFPFIK